MVKRTTYSWSVFITVIVIMIVIGIVCVLLVTWGWWVKENFHPFAKRRLVVDVDNKQLDYFTQLIYQMVFTLQKASKELR